MARGGCQRDDGKVIAGKTIRLTLMHWIGIGLHCVSPVLIQPVSADSDFTIFLFKRREIFDALAGLDVPLSQMLGVLNTAEWGTARWLNCRWPNAEVHDVGKYRCDVLSPRATPTEARFRKVKRFKGKEHRPMENSKLSAEYSTHVQVSRK